MSDIKEEKKVEIKEEKPIEPKEESKIEETPEKKGGKIELRRRHPLSMIRGMDRFFDDITQWFDDKFWRPRLWDFQPLSLKVFEEDPFFRTPLTNISEDESGYDITAEIPGLEKGDLEISIHDGTLEIKGERKEEHKDKDDNGYVRREYHSSSYYRTFTLPENIKEEEIDANLDKGVLKLRLPKKEEKKTQPKKIEVK